MGGKMRNEIFYLRLREKILLFFFFITMLVAGYFYWQYQKTEQEFRDYMRLYYLKTIE